MEFKFTFDDGTEAIAHYGVKGMKWRKHKFGQDEDEEKKDFDARDYGFEDNSALSRKAARGETFGLLAEKGKMSREKAMQLAKEHDNWRRTTEGYATKNEDGSSRTPAQREKFIRDRYNEDVAMAKSFKSRKQLNAELKRKNDYTKESRANKAEYAGDPEGLKRAQKRTDAYYGRIGGSSGKRAQITEAQRRRRSSDRTEAAMRRAGMKRGSDGVWRKA